MDFEYDPQKNLIHIQKHGIDFKEVQLLWEDPDRIEVPARTTDEPRFIIVGKIAGKHWSAVYTFRCEHVRIISARRSRKEEVELYES